MGRVIALVALNKEDRSVAGALAADALNLEAASVGGVIALVALNEGTYSVTGALAADALNLEG